MTVITEISRSNFNVVVVVAGVPHFEEYASEYEVLVACKTHAQNALYGLTSGQEVELKAQAGDRNWIWRKSDNNLLRGVDNTRDWQIFKSFGSVASAAKV